VWSRLYVARESNRRTLLGHSLKVPQITAGMPKAPAQTTSSMPCGNCSRGQGPRAARAGPTRRTRQVAGDGVQRALQRVQLAQNAVRVARHIIRLPSRAAPFHVLSHKHLLACGSHDTWSYGTRGIPLRL